QVVREADRVSILRAWRAPAGGLALAMLALLPAPARALDPERDLQQYKHSRWTIADGVPQSIWALAQGADGYLWIGSSSGVYRFDGVSFEPIPLRVPRSENWRATALLAAADGTIRVGYDNGAMAIYRDGALRLDAAVPDTGAFTIRFAQTADGAIWTGMGRKELGLLRLRGGRWQEIGSEWGFPSEWLMDLTASRDGALWVTTLGSILVLRKGSHRFEKVGAPNGHAAISEDRSGNIWLSDDTGTRILAGASGSIYGVTRTPAALRAFDTSFDRDGNLWGMNGAGIFRMRAPGIWPSRPSAKRVERFGAEDGLSSDLSRSVLEDREGNIWIGTSLGLDRFRPANVVVSSGIGPEGTWGYALLGARNGDIYVGASDGVYRIVPGGRPRRLVGTGAETHYFCEAPNGSIWAIQTDSVTRIRGDRIDRIALPLSQDWRACVVNVANTLFIGGREPLRLSRSGRWERLSFGPDDFPQFLMTDGRRRTLALLHSSRLVKLDPEGAMAGDVLGERLEEVSTILPGARHILFAGVFGIARLVEGRLQTIDGARYPWLIEPSGLVETPDGQTWLIGREGIVGLSSAQLSRAFADPRAPLTPRILTLEDGLPNVYARDGRSSAARGGDGRLWFVTTGGVVWVDPARLTRNALPPPVAIRAVTAGRLRYRDPHALTLAKGTSRLAIQYAGLSLGTPSRVRFRYRLEGMDEDWIDAGARRETYYTNLAPGRYRFRVLAANDDGIWNHDGATLDFTIPPTFLQSIWFKLLVALGVVAILAALYLLRVRQVTARLQSRFDIRIAERERIARELHDTLLQGFQGLMLQIKAGINRLPDPATRQPLDEALTRAQAVLVEGRDRVLDLRMPDQPRDLSEMLLDAAAVVVGDKGPRVQLIAEGASRDLHPVALEELQRIVEEALRNTVHHAKASSIEMLVIWGSRRLSLSLRDDGVGIPATVLMQGERAGHFGLRGMRERAERIGGQLTVSSRNGGGTEIALIVPGGAAYRDAMSRPRLPGLEMLRRVIGKGTL
ncbi:MAG: triple tyrosine motif-containing protein, partial [Sphingomonas sp.]